MPVKVTIIHPLAELDLTEQELHHNTHMQSLVLRCERYGLQAENGLLHDHAKSLSEGPITLEHKPSYQVQAESGYTSSLILTYTTTDDADPLPMYAPQPILLFGPTERVRRTFIEAEDQNPWGVRPDGEPTVVVNEAIASAVCEEVANPRDPPVPIRRTKAEGRTSQDVVINEQLFSSSCTHHPLPGQQDVKSSAGLQGPSRKHRIDSDESQTLLQRTDGNRRAGIAGQDESLNFRTWLESFTDDKGVVIVGGKPRICRAIKVRKEARAKKKARIS